MADKWSLPKPTHPRATLPAHLGDLLSLLQPGELWLLCCPVSHRPPKGLDTAKASIPAHRADPRQLQLPHREETVTTSLQEGVR